MLHTKNLSSVLSSLREEKVVFLCSYVPTCDPLGEASFDPQDRI